ncbi:hypothetical protein [Bradyrhizobium viridifuturi]|nr:hypothetical protein [Bradyrhizobium viridifuturi]
MHIDEALPQRGGAFFFDLDTIHPALFPGASAKNARKAAGRIA